MRVTVLESRNRVGGRVLSYRHISGSPEAGGTSFGAGYARMIGHNPGVGRGPGEPRSGAAVLQCAWKLALDGRIISAAEWPEHERQRATRGRARDHAVGYLTFKDVHEQSVSSNRGLAGARIRPLGRVAARSYLTGQGETDAVVDLCYDNNPGWGNNADGVSAAMVLFAMRFAAAQQGFTGPDGGTMYTAVNGNQSVPEAMAASLGGDLLLERRVTAIRDTGSGVEVHCEDGSLHRADRVISSLPCSLLRSLDLDPGLEGLQAEAAHTIDSQILNQLHLVAKRPFWEDDGLAPSMWTDSLAGMVLAERKGATPEEVTSLTSWTRGSLAVEMDQLPNEEAAARIVADIERLRPAAKGQLRSWRTSPGSMIRIRWATGQCGSPARLRGWRIPWPGNTAACISAANTRRGPNRGMEGALDRATGSPFEVLDLI